jgi:hypothetical protein
MSDRSPDCRGSYFVAARPLTSGSPPEAKNNISNVTVQDAFPKGKKVARNLVDQSGETHKQPTIATDGLWLHANDGD